MSILDLHLNPAVQKYEWKPDLFSVLQMVQFYQISFLGKTKIKTDGHLKPTNKNHRIGPRCVSFTYIQLYNLDRLSLELGIRMFLVYRMLTLKNH